ncbi:MAG: deoxyribonuclease IV [Deltaproteobacteria bacterium]|jgi:deoxyribonuclease-4|nr:deoxyribonuclease IV [Deltaproteobacteria bacterium]
MKHWLGAHVSIAGGLPKAFARAENIGCRAMQIFTKNANRWKARPISVDEARAFQLAWAESSIGPVLAHNSYLINLASPKNSLWIKSKEALIDEIRRCDLLGISMLVIHPGAHLGTGERPGLDRIRRALDEILHETPDTVQLLLENTAGQGSCLGAEFAHLAALMEGYDPKRLGVCLDTCHAQAAGYELSHEAGYASTLAEFDSLIGVKHIKAFHVNDSLKSCGSRIDRHTHIGQGTIGTAGFAILMNDLQFIDRPMILETPKGEAEHMDRVNLKLLNALADR